MKTMNHIIWTLALLLTLSSCDKEDEVFPTELSGTDIEKLDNYKWHLRSVVCECPGVFLERGDYTWDFDTKDNTVMIESNTTEDPLLRASGVYDITISGDSLVMSDVFYIWSIQGNKLILDESGMSSLDAPLYSMEAEEAK